MRSFVVNGYEIIAGENEIIFVDRKTWGLAWLMLSLGLAAAGLVLLSALRTTGATELRSDVLELALPAVAVLLFVVVWIASRTYRARRAQPAEEIRDILILDWPSQALCDRMGRMFAQLDDVKARMHIDWWTRGTMRIVVLSWPGGRRTIYRSLGRRRSLDLLAFLRERGLDAE